MCFFSSLSRSNSKASYLPRQSHEKLASDPDHGSYKLTLNSNEDCIHLPHYNNGQLHSAKINNLPDVLPLGVKIKSMSATRYGSNTALSNGNGDVSNGVINNNHHYEHQQHQQQHQQQQQQHQHFHHSNMAYTNGKMNAMMNSTKYISQSTIDLKRAHHLFNNSSNNGNNNVCARITGTESMGNLLDCSNHRQSSPPSLQPSVAHANEQRVQISATNVAQHNAMNTNGLVQPSLPPSLQASPSSQPRTPSSHRNSDTDKLARCNNIMDSLLTAREQDTKISQLQLQTNLLTSQCIHRANIAEINDDDAYNDCLSTDDSSSMSQLSSESISSADLNLNSSLSNAASQTYMAKEALKNKNDIITKANQASDGTTADHGDDRDDDDDDDHDDVNNENSQLADSLTSNKLNETTTSEVGSQTDESISDDGGCNGLNSTGNDNESNDSNCTVKTDIQIRTRFADDCKRLTESLVEQLSPNDRLRNILGNFLSLHTHIHTQQLKAHAQLGNRNKLNISFFSVSFYHFGNP